MQTLPVTATPPVTSAQSPASAESNAAQATEPFGNVLARQRANTAAPQDGQQNDKQDGKQALSPANDASPSVAGKDSTDSSQIPVPDANAVSASMLAALLTVPAVADKSATNDKAGVQAPSPDGTVTLPGDMLAMLLPATAAKGASSATAQGIAAATSAATAKGIATANEKVIQELAAGGEKKTRPQQIETAMPGEIPQPAGKKMAPQSPEIAGDPKFALAHAQKSGKPGEASADINASKDKVFAAALEASAKGAAKTAQLDAGLTKTHMQPDTPAALDGLLQNGVAPLAASQNGAAQAAQAVINTPVTHEAWGDEFNQKVTWMAAQHEQTAELHLNPPNLGPLDVVLKVSGDQATALFTSPHAAVRDAVEQALPKLRDMMADNGIMLGNAMVSDQSPKDQQAWQASQQQRGNGGTSGKIDADIAIGAAASSAVLPIRRHQGMVDTFV